MRLNTTTPVGALVVLLSACGTAVPELTDAQRSEIAAEVEQQNAALWEAARQADFDAVAVFYDHGSEFTWAHQGHVYSSWQAIDEAARPIFDATASQRIDIADSYTTVLGLDLAYVLVSGTFSQTDTAGVSGEPIRFAWGGVWGRRDGTWKVLMGFQSDAPSESM